MDDGQIRRIQAVGPNAVVTSDVTSRSSWGDDPLRRHARRPTPIPAATLTYAWDLDGDGNFNDSTSSKPSFTYSAEGKYTVRLKSRLTSASRYQQSIPYYGRPASCRRQSPHPHRR